MRINQWSTAIIYWKVMKTARRVKKTKSTFEKKLLLTDSEDEYLIPSVAGNILVTAILISMQHITYLLENRPCSKCTAVNLLPEVSYI